MSNESESTKTATRARPRGRSAEKSDGEKKQIGIRLTDHHYRIALALALPDGEKVARVLERLLEAELREQQTEATKFVENLASSVSKRSDAATSIRSRSVTVPTSQSERVHQVSLRIPIEYFRVASILAAAAGSVPKVCEPLLDEALEAKQAEAVKAAQKLARQLKKHNTTVPGGG